MAKKIYFNTILIHNYTKSLLDNPPEGYEFIIDIDNKKKELIDKLKKSPIANFLYKRIIKKFFNVWAVMNKSRKESPQNIDLIFSTDSLIEENKPWVIKILDNPFAMAGNSYELFKKNLEKIKKSLSSNNCKRIIVHTEASKNLIKKYFSKEILEKVSILTPAIPGIIKEKKIRPTKDFTILFMGSTNNPEVFYLKGGLEALETFKLLSKKYESIKLIMRCKIPKEIMKKYGDLKNVEFLERRLTDEEMDNLYKNSDILLSPGYNYFVMAYLEAFSYGLPIVALDTYGVNEFVIEGVNGFLVKPSKLILMNQDDYPANAMSEEFTNVIKKGDEEVIKNLAEKVAILIEDKELLEKFSKEGQKMFKEKYSFEKKQEKLKEIFDKAINN